MIENNNSKIFINIINKTLNISLDDININLSQDDCITWDSLTHITLINKLEETFNVSFSKQDIFDMYTIEDVKNHLLKLGVKI